MMIDTILSLISINRSKQMSQYTVEDVTTLRGFLGAVVKTDLGIEGMVSELRFYDTGCARVDVTRSVVDLEKINDDMDTYTHTQVDISKVSLVAASEIDQSKSYVPITEEMLGILGSNAQDTLTKMSGIVTGLYFHVDGAIKVVIHALTTDAEKHPIPRDMGFVYPYPRMKILQPVDKSFVGLDSFIHKEVETVVPQNVEEPTASKKPRGGPSTSRDSNY
jgi:hypothetical protein